MERKYPMIAAAVAAALGASMASAPASAALAAPTLAQAAAPTVSLVMAGSSAAKAAIALAITNDICGSGGAPLNGVLSLASSGGTKNFLAYSCFTGVAIPAAGGGLAIPAGTLTTIYYRTEGGSVVGALPIAANHQIKRLDISACVAGPVCTVAGTNATTNGPTDSWGPAGLVLDTVQLGLTDVEPGQLTSGDYPSLYNAANFGSATAAQMAALPVAKALDQVFGLMVNTVGLTPPAANGANINLTRESARNILLGKVSDWSAVPDAITGLSVSKGPAPIHVINREPGSGTRTATNIAYMNYQCGSLDHITDATGAADNYATGDELNAVNTTNGAIGYASIDNILVPSLNTYANLKLATIDQIPASNLAAATGAYGAWYEATFVPVNLGATASQSLSQFIQTDVPKLSQLPQLPDIMAIPGVAGNVASVSLANGIANNGGAGTAEVYLNPYTRGASSCNLPTTTVLLGSP